MKELNGIGVALVTPFQENGQIDFDGLKKLVNHLKNDLHFLVVMGTTGEAATLSEEEKLSVLDFVLEVNAGQIPVVYGMGGNDTAVLANQMKSFDRDGVSAFLTASPSYNKPTQEGIYRHYLALSDSSPLPIILYNVPSRTGSNVLPETVERIARDAEKIVAIKEAAADISQVMELSAKLPKDFALLSGDDPLLLPHLACGGDGLISVAANAFPKIFRAIYDACLDGDYEAARKEQFKMSAFISEIFAEGNPGGIKTALEQLGICEIHLRLPLYPVSETQKQKIVSATNDLS
ncbi:MAG: 4-hydroxy-tetrahydrodipicolinate synthase [Bacteroidota bacterium]